MPTTESTTATTGRAADVHARFRRAAVTAALLVAPVLIVVSTALHGPFVADHAERLADLEAAGIAGWASAVLFVLTQVPMLVALLGTAHLVRHGSPRLSITVSVLAVLATFGEAVMGGTGLVYLTMAGRGAGERDAFAGVWEQMESSPVMLFGGVGFGGTVLALLLLSIAVFRSRVAPRWVGPLVSASLLLELAGSGLTVFASYAAAVCLLIAFGALAAAVRATPLGEWEAHGSLAACGSSSPEPPASSAPTSSTTSGGAATR